jgi:hypothetical protein
MNQLKQKRLTKELTDKVFHYQNFYNFGLGNTERFFKILKNYDEANRDIEEFKKLMNSKFNCYVKDFKDYLVTKNILEVGPEQYELTEFGFDCIKEYFYEKQKEDTEAQEHIEVRKYLSKNGYLDSLDRLSPKGFKAFSEGF